MNVYVLTIGCDADIDYAWDYEKFQIAGVYLNRKDAEALFKRIADEHDSNDGCWDDEEEPELHYYMTIEEHELKQ